jgi:hypothetical protein
MIHYWKLDENSPSYVDIYGNNNATCSNCPSAVPGIVSGAQRFNSVNQVNVADDNTFDWNTGDSFSVEFWMKADQAEACSGDQVVVGRDGGSSQVHWWAGCWEGGKAAFVAQDAGGNTGILAGTTYLTDGFWHHITAVRDAGTNELRLYVDGAKEDSMIQNYTGGFDSTTVLNIGWLNLNSGFHFVGAVDEVALYGRALPGAEIAQHFTNGSGGNGYCYGYFTVTPAAGANGSISPSTKQNVIYNGTASFTVTPNSGYHISSVTGCGGTLAGNTYTTGPITVDCTVTASFAPGPATYTVTPSAGANGSISPSTKQVVPYNSVISFTVTPNPGYRIASVTGCGGTLDEDTYTTGLITVDCTVTATFAIYDVVRRVSGVTYTYYSTLQAAYDPASNGDIIQSQALSFSESLIFDLDRQVTLHGGYDSTFSYQEGFTTIRTLTVSLGTVIVDGLTLN